MSGMIGNFFERTPSFDDPIGMLRACHRRIERAVEILLRVAGRAAEGPLDAPARTALRQVLDYFATSVPRHTADEEESLFPRLAVGAPREAAEAARWLSEQHAVLESLHAEAERLGRELVETGALPPGEAGARRLAEVAAQLRQIYTEHIRAEDDALFPLAERTLAREELERVGQEMAARRGLAGAAPARGARRSG